MPHRFQSLLLISNYTILTFSIQCHFDQKYTQFAYNIQMTLHHFPDLHILLNVSFQVYSVNYKFLPHGFIFESSFAITISASYFEAYKRFSLTLIPPLLSLKRIV